MTQEELFADLKQFIATTVSQQVSDVREDISRLGEKIEQLKTDVDERLDVIQEAIGEAQERNEAKFDDHDQRLRRLEQRPA
ncbi:hypothetical protein [Fodinicola acaciae]|uniref:hypothetical protein n=1 Tax=Fodinicola acaciae TaxID=2681555 RepID=UPI0013D3B6D0|nr:hypothetical protein [Fodinicola acaciae]